MVLLRPKGVKSNPFCTLVLGDITQLVECALCKREVKSSNLFISTGSITQW